MPFFNGSEWCSKALDYVFVVIDTISTFMDTVSVIIITALASVFQQASFDSFPILGNFLVEKSWLIFNELFSYLDGIIHE